MVAIAHDVMQFAIGKLEELQSIPVSVALEPFGQVGSQMGRAAEGTGLGLPLVKYLTELHGGQFTIVSELGVGTTATVRLPASRVVTPASRVAL